MRDRYFMFEEKVSFFCKRHAIQFLRYSLGIVYMWFGFLKIGGISPIEELVLRATHWIDVHNIVIVIGVWEVIIGVCFLFKRLKRAGIILYFLHLPGIWLPLFLNPEDAFIAVPYGLTLEGQYIIKNIVLLAAVLAIIGSLHPRVKKI